MKWITPAVFVLLPLVMSCAASSPSRPSSPAVVAQWSGQQGGAPSAGDRILRTAEEWQRVWQQVRREPPRSLDPASEMGIVVFLGERATGGHTVEIVDAQVLGENYVVTFRATSPRAGDMTTQALTTPWVVAVVKRSDLPTVLVPLAPQDGARQRPEPPQMPGARQER